MGRGRAALAVAMGLAAIGTVSPTRVAAAADPPITSAVLDGEADAYVLGNVAGHHVVATPTYLGLRGPNIVMFDVDGYQLWFAPIGAGTLAVGTYEDAQRADFRAPGHPGLELFGGGRGCNSVTGRFIVDEITWDAGTLTSFSARFEHHCEGGTAAVLGAVSYQATAPFRDRTVTPGGLGFGVVTTGAASSSQTVTIQNNGPAPLAVGPVGLTSGAIADFDVDASGCEGTMLPSGGSCSVSVRFVPTGAPGGRTARLTVFDDLAPLGGSGTGRDVLLEGAAVAPLDPSGELSPLTPARLLDTRDGTGGRSGPLGPAESLQLQVTGRGGVPATGVAAVVLNVTAVEPSAASFATVWPAGGPRPTISNLNVTPGQTVANLVTVALGTGGKVSLYNDRGRTHLVADVVGYYASSGGPLGSRFRPATPVRFFDTRSGGPGVAAAPLGPNQTLSFKVTGRGPVPIVGVTAVVMNVTVTAPTAGGFLTVYPSDVGRPLASNLNFAPGVTVPNLVVVRVPANGLVSFYNPAGSTHVIADVVGYFVTDHTGDTGRFVGISPDRILDSRDFDSPIGPDEIAYLEVAGAVGIPTTGVAAAVLNVTAVSPTSGGFLTVFPDDACAVPYASNLNFARGQTAANLAMVGLSPATPSGCAVAPGAIDLYNAAGSTHVIVDAFGYFRS